MLIFGAVTKSYITRMFKSNSGEPYAGKLHVRFLEEFIFNCLIIREGENLLMQMKFLLDGVFNFNMINYIKVRFLTMKKVFFICHGRTVEMQ